MPAWIPGFFSQVVQLQVIVFTPLTCVLLVCLVNMLHLSQERQLLTGQVQQHLLFSVVLLCASLVFPSAALAAVNAVSVKQQMCEKRRMCLFTHVLYVDVLACAKATALLSGWLSCNGARDTFCFYLSLPQLSLLCLERVCWTGYTWRTVNSTNPSNYAECHSPAHTLDSDSGKQKLMGTFSKCATFMGLFKCHERTESCSMGSLCCVYSKERWKFFFP